MATVCRPRAFAANQRCRTRKSRSGPRAAPPRTSITCPGLESDILNPVEHGLRPRWSQPEPVVAIGRHADEVGLGADRGEARLAEQLQGGESDPSNEVHVYGMAGPR